MLVHLHFCTDVCGTTVTVIHILTPRVTYKILLQRVGLQFAMFLRLLEDFPGPTRACAPGHRSVS